MKIEFKDYKMFIDGDEIKQFRKASLDNEVIQTMIKLKRLTLKHIENKFKKTNTSTIYVIINRINQLCEDRFGVPLLVKDEGTPNYWFVNHYLVEKESRYESFIINIPKIKVKELMDSFGSYLYTNAPVVETDEFIKF